MRLLVQVRNPADGAPADPPDRLRQPQQFARLGEGPRHALAVGGRMRDGARGGEAARPGPERLLGERRHQAHILLVRRLVGDAALAHGVGAERAMRQLGRDIHRARAPVERVQIFGKGLPLPGQPLGQRRARNVLHALHHADQPVMRVRARRGEADAAIAHRHRGDAMPAGGRELAVPDRLAVIMGVDVDEAGRHQRAGGVDLAPGGAGLAADRQNAAVPDRDVAGESGAARAVEHPPAANGEVKHGPLPPARRSSRTRGRRARCRPARCRDAAPCGSRGRARR